MWLTTVFRIAASGRLALVLLLLLTLLTVSGAILPQAGRMAESEILAWQALHPVVTAWARPCGLFHVFQSWPFLGVVALLILNTLVCVVEHLLEGGWTAFKGPKALDRIGFIILHVAITGVGVGALLSGAFRMTGFILLTEGQRFHEAHGSYLKRATGPLHKETHRGFELVLKRVHLAREGPFTLDVASDIEVHDGADDPLQATIRFNEPLLYEQLSFAQRETGYSPRVAVRDAEGRPLVDTYVALRTERDHRGEWRYRDFIVLPNASGQIMLTLIPDYEIDKDGKVVKTADEPNDPLLLVEQLAADQSLVQRGHIEPGGQSTVGDFRFAFLDLRRWSSFKVVEDRGYPVIWVSMWLGIGALLLRYAREVVTWLQPEKC